MGLDNHQQDDSISGTSQGFTLRTHRPGDMGFITYRHGSLYAKEYGWDHRFEALVAQVGADFLNSFDPTCERSWIAEKDGAFLGCVLVIKDKTAEKTAKLRLLLVEPSARGLGLGKTLVHEVTLFARKAGYEKIVLWTNSVLTAARGIYQREGYTLTGEEVHENFGPKVVGQLWELKLDSCAA